MAKAEDAAMPVPGNIQRDLADLKKAMARVESEVDANATRMDSLEGYLTYTMGLTSRNQHDMKRLQGQFQALTDRCDALEPQS
jgi:hypothetical protein